MGSVRRIRPQLGWSQPPIRFSGSTVPPGPDGSSARLSIRREGDCSCVRGSLFQGVPRSGFNTLPVGVASCPWRVRGSGGGLAGEPSPAQAVLNSEVESTAHDLPELRGTVALCIVAFRVPRLRSI
jgi:hypothetical protein